MKISTIAALALIALFLSSCSSTTQLLTHGVGYQSVRKLGPHFTEVAPDAKIATWTHITKDGKVQVTVNNLTDEIMIIDQTLSFLVNTNGVSRSYYDPTVRTTTETQFSSGTKGASVNLGSLADAFGVGGAIGTIMGGVNVGGSGTQGTSVENTTIFADQPRIALSPKSRGAMSKVFALDNIAADGLNKTAATASDYNSIDPKTSPLKFSVCISYSLDNGETFDKIVTDFYVNSWIYVPVRGNADINDAMRRILSQKTDAITEPCGFFHFNTSQGLNYGTIATGGFFIDYK